MMLYSTFMVLKCIDYIGLNSMAPLMINLYKENDVIIEIMGYI